VKNAGIANPLKRIKNAKLLPVATVVNKLDKNIERHETECALRRRVKIILELKP
jgi:hypothetical protein